MGDFYAGGFAAPDSQIEIFLREGIILISKNLVNEAVALVDVYAPPDFVLNSPLGMSDGEVNPEKYALFLFYLLKICIFIDSYLLLFIFSDI